MQVGVGLAKQPAQIGIGFVVVLLARDALLNFDRKGLDSDLELKYAGRKLCNQCPERVRQMVGHRFEMHEQAGTGCAVAGGGQPVKEELQDAHGNIDLEVERSVHELEIARPALVKAIHFPEKTFEVKCPGRLVQGAQTKLALERAPARRLDVHDAIHQVSIGIFRIGQHDLIKIGLLAGDDLHQRTRTLQHGSAELGEAQIPPAANDVISQPSDLLFVGLMADLRSAQYYRNVGTR